MSLFEQVSLITSFNKQGWQQYGRKMVETFSQYWPKSTRLYVLYQGDFDLPLYDNVTWIALDEDEKLQRFKAKFGNFMQAHGVQVIDNQGKLQLVKNYRYDALRFCHKVFSILHVLNEEGSTRYLVWLDGDTYTKTSVTEGWLASVLPKPGEFHTYLKRRNDCSEAGYLAFDLEHEKAGLYFHKLDNMWMNGDIFAEKEWHDSFIFDVLRAQMPGPHFRSISVGGSGTVHPFTNSILGPVMEHLKGPIRKVTGTSAGAEFTNPSPANIIAPTGGRYAQLDAIINRVKPKTIVEIGTWNGFRASEMIRQALNHQETVTYTGYDLFETATPQTDEREKNVKPHFNIDVVTAFLEDLQTKFNGRFQFTLIKGDTRQTLKERINADFVFIDGGHSVETIRHDFDMLRGSKCIVLDDYYVGAGIDTNKFGCNAIVEPLDHIILRAADPIVGGGTTQFVIVEKDTA